MTQNQFIYLLEHKRKQGQLLQLTIRKQFYLDAWQKGVEK